MSTYSRSPSTKYASWSEGDREYVLTSYQDTMRQFLHTQESVMLAYLSGRMDRRHLARPPRTLTAIRAPSAAPRATAVQPLPASAAPAPEASVSAPPVARAPARAETAPRRNDNGSGNGAVSSVAVHEAATSAAAPPASPPSNGDLDKSAVTDLLLGIVEERTGYSRDMLALDRDMEADLGIDSIKRVEIIGALLKAMPSTFFNGGDDPSQALNAEKTLTGVLDWIEKHRAAVEGNNRPFELTGARDSDADRAPLPRYRIEARSEDTDAVAVESLPDGLYMITEDESGVAKALATLIAGEGKEAAILPRDLLPRFDELASHVQELRSEAGPVRGIVHLAPISARALDGTASAQAWRLETCCNEKALFRLLQLTCEDIRAGGRVLAASSLGGRFGRDAPRPNLYAAGGFVGLLKSLNDEWPETTVKAVDTDFESSAENRAREIFHELCLPGGRIEVGYPAGQRTAFYTVPAPLPDAATGAKGWRPSETSVILVTGGARGITPEILRDSLPAGATVVIVGRTPEPGPEPENTKALMMRDDLRRHYIEQARAQGDSVRPIDIERKINELIRDRELGDNLAALRSAGVSVDYRPGDVRDEVQLQAITDDVYARYGHLDGVIHAAGVIEDRWLTSKEPDSWDRVFDTKADGAFFLWKVLRPESLRFVAFFSSVAGRYGNSGQTDYACANELLNRLACQLHATWRGSVRVVSLNWGPWHQTSHGQGMISPETQRKFEAMGVSLVSIKAGRRAFWDELACGPSTDVEVVLGGGPWEAREAEMGTWRTPAVAAASTIDGTRLPLLAGAYRAGRSNGVVRFRRVLDTKRDLYLSEHLLDDVSVLPATAALEMIAEAAAAASPDLDVLEIHDFRALRGVSVGGRGVELELAVGPGKELAASGREVEVELCVVGDRSIPHYRATVVLGDVLPDPISFSEIGGSSHESVTVSAHDAYRNWLFHGPRLQLMTGDLEMNETGAIASVRPTDPAVWIGMEGHFGGRWLFDPGLLDTAPQMAIVWARKMRDTCCLPARVGRVRRFGDAPLGPCRLYFSLRDGADQTTVRADVAYVDSAARVRLLVEDMHCTASVALNRLGGGWKGEIRV